MLYLPVSLLVPILIGFAFVSILWPGTFRSHPMIKSCLAVGAGFGIFSILFFLSLLFFGASSKGLLLAEIVLLISLVAILGYKIKRGKPNEDRLEVPSAGSSTLGKVLFIIFLLAFLSSIIAFAFISLKKPHGDWDAWAVHNMRARFIFRAGEQWRDAYSDHLAWSSLDYPLLVTGSVAGCWRIIGDDTVLVPIILGGLFTFATVALAALSLGVTRGRIQGYLAGLILLCTPLLITHGASQYLDIPLGFFFLATIVLLNLQSRFSDEETGLLPLAGFMAGLGAWTKNEGLLFIIAILVAQFIVTLPKRGLKVYLKQTLRMGAGLLPVLVVLIYFKTGFAASSAFFEPGGQSTLEKIIDVSRYVDVFKRFVIEAFDFGEWPVSIPALLILYILLAGVSLEQKEKSSIVAAALVLALMTAGYFFIFIITPRDLNWHLESTLHRLFIQLFPSCIFLFFMLARPPEQAIAGRLNHEGTKPQRI
jgi:hypothetical protein